MQSKEGAKTGSCVVGMLASLRTLQTQQALCSRIDQTIIDGIIIELKSSFTTRELFDLETARVGRPRAGQSVDRALCRHATPFGTPLAIATTLVAHSHSPITGARSLALNAGTNQPHGRSRGEADLLTQTGTISKQGDCSVSRIRFVSLVDIQRPPDESSTVHPSDSLNQGLNNIGEDLHPERFPEEKQTAVSGQVFGWLQSFPTVTEHLAVPSR
ncbi:hypothetical protein N7462_008106 [Penicillium macrosclerotiorum]|uniref:uncharacterized protein n=1 Tax=Penicillium macrosclerotiorum TaxID=303699 RepID=UPI002548D122|nr:uncharacterized protein N7462_008106 [Penicillium macrosclerotiorum]KAJ5679862.1 hypothetical protein N7462_008106 [Penicillium macrosclerotiorum]